MQFGDNIIQHLQIVWEFGIALTISTAISIIEQEPGTWKSF